LNLLDGSKTEAAPISVLAVDLDKFKLINDVFGHATGDEVLRVLADVLRGATRKNDMAARLGGDEFTLVLPSCGFNEALAVAGRVRAKFQDNARFLDGKVINATVSVGVATAPGDGSSLEGLFASADEALYRAKNLGRNQFASSSNDLAAPSEIPRIA
jgi:diguanylate cyclase (GGDEF)-like protein